MRHLRQAVKLLADSLPSGAAIRQQTQLNTKERWVVKVHFSIDSTPREICSFADRESAEREARQYSSDSKGVWIVAPDGTNLKLDKLTGTFSIDTGKVGSINT
jgi:hypothetical protein